MIRSTSIRAICAAALCLLPLMTTAGSNAAPPEGVAAIEVLPGWSTDNGEYVAAILVRLAPGWKTYWRAPGEAGIPPMFDWSGSRNLKTVRFHWPVPEVFHQNGMRAIGYRDQMILPMFLTPAKAGQAMVLSGQIELGVCQDICLPVTVTLNADIPAGGSADPQIRAALNDRALTGQEAGLRSVSCDVSPVSDGLRITATIDLPRQGAEETVVFETGDQRIWVAEATATRSGNTLRAVTDLVPPNAKPFLLSRSDLRITVLGKDRAVEIQGCPGG